MKKLKSLVPQSVKNYYHFVQAILANLTYNFPSRKIKIIGVTGTNGKTTTCQMIAKVLEEAGFKVALASTINFKIGEKESVNRTKFTTLSSFAVQKFIAKAARAKCEYLVLEVSSHSLDQNRVWGIEFYAGVITNITREHLDYHKTMEEYRQAKAKLFRNVQTAVINLDLNNPEGFLNERMDKACGYSTSQKHHKAGFMSFIAEDIKLNSSGSEFNLNGEKFELNIPGKFNIENALAAICFGTVEGLKMETMVQALGKIKLIPGRMERVPNDKGLNIIIDYAVTPDSLEKLYELINQIKCKKGSKSPIGLLEPKIISVFGACGERDRGKRPIMGEIVSRYADYIILTNEDPYGEDPKQIIDEVFKGVINSKSETLNSKQVPNYKFKIKNSFSEGENCWRILGRRDAIRFALELAKPEYYVIITGKGAEETMAIGKKRIPWNDRRVILEELRKTN